MRNVQKFFSVESFPLYGTFVYSNCKPVDIYRLANYLCTQECIRRGGMSKHVTPIEAHSLVKIIELYLVTSTHSCSVRCKFRPVSNFMEFLKCSCSSYLFCTLYGRPGLQNQLGYKTQSSDHHFSIF